MVSNGITIVTKNRLQSFTAKPTGSGMTAKTNGCICHAPAANSLIRYSGHLKAGLIVDLPQRANDVAKIG
jgi:hypothetical protein